MFGELFTLYTRISSKVMKHLNHYDNVWIGGVFTLYTRISSKVMENLNHCGNIGETLCPLIIEYLA